MVNFVDTVFFIYTFIGLYMTSLMIFIYLPNRNKIFKFHPMKTEPVSIIIPCFNEASAIGGTIESLLKLDYPKDFIEIIVVDDKSQDNSVEVIKNYVCRYPNVKLIINEKNSGGAAEPTNLGIRSSKYDFIAVTDADSRPDPSSLKKMIGFLQSDNKVAAVTCSVLVDSPKTFIQKLQSFEYQVIAFTRKLLDFVDSIYVTPGPFALYRKKTLLEVGLFDKENITQDIEIVWRLVSRGYIARMSLDATVHSIAPDTFRKWWKQRIRWSIGGTQTLLKYRRFVFRKGMLGLFIIPFFALSTFLGIFGVGLFLYLLSRNLLVSYLTTKYSVYAQTAVFRLEDLSFMPTVLNFFGLILLFLGVGFTLFALFSIKDKHSPNRNFFNLSFYLLVYLTIYPLISIVAIIKLITGKYTW